MGLFYFFCLSSLIVYFLMGSGWSSSRKYSMLGGYRSVSQSISYEVRMVFCLLGFCYILMSYNFIFWGVCQYFGDFYFYSIPILYVWLLICLAECNRSPFDFSEGESELVSGFNVEYGGGLFSVIRIVEYGSILFIRIYSVYFFAGRGFLRFKFLLIFFSFLWLRATLPRMRYDFLMIIA